MKRCCVCKQRKPRSEFWRNRTRKDGLQTACKVCLRERYRDTHVRNSDRDKRDPRKVEARLAVQRAVAAGTLHKPDRCEGCGRQVEARLLHGHHRDYNKPLEVEWLCTTCHQAQHEQEDTMPANQTYNPRHTRKIDTAVKQISCAVGSVVVTPLKGDVVTIEAGEHKDFDTPLAGLTIFSPRGARVNVVYETDPDPAPPPERKTARRTRPKRRGTKRQRRASSTKSSGSKASSKKKG